MMAYADDDYDRYQQFPSTRHYVSTMTCMPSSAYQGLHTAPQQIFWDVQYASPPAGPVKCRYCATYTIVNRRDPQSDTRCRQCGAGLVL